MDTAITIYRGASFSYLLEFLDADGVAIDLTGLSPFHAQVRDEEGAPLLLEMTVANTDLSAGKLTISAAAADTAAIPIRDSQWDLIDTNDRVWVPPSTAHLCTKRTLYVPTP